MEGVWSQFKGEVVGGQSRRRKVVEEGVKT